MGGARGNEGSSGSFPTGCCFPHARTCCSRSLSNNGKNGDVSWRTLRDLSRDRGRRRRIVRMFCGDSRAVAADFPPCPNRKRFTTFAHQRALPLWALAGAWNDKSSRQINLIHFEGERIGGGPWADQHRWPRVPQMRRADRLPLSNGPDQPSSRWMPARLQY